MKGCDTDISMSKKILLINPWIHDFAAYDFWIKPLGLLYLGSLLRHNQHHVALIDCLDPYHPLMTQSGQKKPKRYPAGDGKFFRQMIPAPPAFNMHPKHYSRYGILPDIFISDLKRNRDADMVLITSMMTYWYPGVFEAIRILKDVLPGIPIVLGGKYATLCHDHAVKFSGADDVIAGAGEQQIFDLIKKLFGEDPSFLPDHRNLDSFPYPAFDLIDKIEHLPIITSRGCPFRCSYCASHLFNHSFRRRDPIKVADEIEHWQNKYGVIHFTFYDDALLVRPDEMIVPLLNELKKRGVTCQFHCPNGLHLREITREMALLLHRSGFKTIRFGFETSDFNQQVKTGGKVKNDELRRAVMHLKNAGYQSRELGIYLLCGMPGQRAREVIDSIAFVQECGARPLLAEYSPIPGTEMWDQAVACSPFDILHEPLYHNNSLLPCRNDDFSMEVYKDLKRKLNASNQQVDRHERHGLV